MGAPPKVSVIIPVHNAEGYVERCVMSVLRQTIGTDRLEIIAVDDGSDDDSGAILDRLALANPALTVVHQPASGGPSRPRNAGLDHASGEFVFFLDSDDHLGTEALERMLAMAERNDSDIVLGKTVNPGGRHVSPGIFRHSLANADLFGSDVYYTLNPLKLFRRSLIEEHGLRFPEGLRVGEDQPFVAHAYLHARAISIVADYDCYHWTRRTDGSSLTQRGVDYFERLPQTEEVIELVAAHTEPGAARDHLVARHLQFEVLKRFNKRFLKMKPERQRRLTAEIKQVLDRWMTDDIRRRLNTRWRLRAYCVQNDLFDELLEVVRSDLGEEKPAEITENGRVYLAHPLFRAGTIPDEHFDRTSRKPIDHVLRAVEFAGGVLLLRGRATWGPDADQRVEVVLREGTTGEEHRVPADAPDFEVRLDLATMAGGGPLPPGLWDVSVAVTVNGMTSESRLGKNRAVRVHGASRTWHATLGGTPVTVTARQTHGPLTFEVTEPGTVPYGQALAVDEVTARTPSTVVINGHRAPGHTPDPGEDDAVTVRLTGPDDEVHTVDTKTNDDGGFTATIPLETVAGGDPLPEGDWTVTLHTSFDGLGQTTWIGVPRPHLTARWRHEGHRYRVRAVSTGRPPGLTLRVATVRADRIDRLRRLRRLFT